MTIKVIIIALAGFLLLGCDNPVQKKEDRTTPAGNKPPVEIVPHTNPGELLNKLSGKWKQTNHLTAILRKSSYAFNTTQMTVRVKRTIVIGGVTRNSDFVRKLKLYQAGKKEIVSMVDNRGIALNNIVRVTGNTWNL